MSRHAHDLPQAARVDARPVAPEHGSASLPRSEIRCSRCACLLGHVFDELAGDSWVVEWGRLVAGLFELRRESNVPIFGARRRTHRIGATPFRRGTESWDADEDGVAVGGAIPGADVRAAFAGVACIYCPACRLLQRIELLG